MASLTLNTAATYPDGTSVSIYVASGQSSSGGPLGTAVNTQTTAAGSATFTGLTTGERYIAFGLVGSDWRRISCSIDAAPHDALYADESASPTGDWTFTGAVDLSGATVTPDINADSSVHAADNTTFTGDNTFTGAVDLTGATVTPDYAGDITALDTRLDSAETTISSHTTTISSHTTSISGLDTDMNTAQGDITALDTRLDTAEADITALEAAGGGSGITVNVLDEGAAGDGSTDDTAAIAAAITAAGTNGTVYFPGDHVYMVLGNSSGVLDALDGQTWLGDGPGSIIRAIAATGTTKLVRLNTASSKTRFQNLRFEGAATFGDVSDRNYAIMLGNQTGVEVECFNCEFSRFGPAISAYNDTTGQRITVVNCLIDGDDIGEGTGGQKQVTGLAPQADCTLIARNCDFKNLGSENSAGAPGGLNQCHAIYAYQSAVLDIEGCRFTNHHSGRYIQCYDNPTSPVTPKYWRVAGCFFGDYNSGGSSFSYVQTNARVRSLITGCTFNINSLDTDAAVLVQGNAMIRDCYFTGSSATMTSYFIQVDPEFDSATVQEVSVDGCVFEDSDTSASGYCIHLPTEADDTWLRVSNCEFRSAKTCIRAEGQTGTRISVSNTLFDLASGFYGIDIASSSTITALIVQGSEFLNGSVGIYERTGTTLTLFMTRDNYFTGQSSAAITKSGTTTTETAKDNQGYSDV